jgi:hypothetical protein
MTLDAITCPFKEAHDAFPPLEGKPSNDELLDIRETLLPLLMVISYNQLNGVHSLTAILAKSVKYKQSKVPNLYAQYISHYTTSQLLKMP